MVIKYRMMSAAASCLLALAASPAAQAQTSPLGGLIGAMNGLARVLAPQANAQMPSVAAVEPGEGTTDGIMKLLADRASMIPPPCNFLDNSIKRALSDFQVRQYAMAGAGARLTAEQAAACILSGKGPVFPDPKGMVGELLAVSAIANHKTGLDTPENLLTAQQALALLNVNASRNKDIIGQLNAAGILPVAQAQQSGEPVLSAGARDLALKYKANSFAFEREYKGKVLNTTGKIQSIGGSGDRALIVLEGVRKPNINDQGWNDVIQCTVSDGAGLDAAMKVSKGQTVTVQGIFENHGLGGVALQDCRVLR